MGSGAVRRVLLLPQRAASFGFVGLSGAGHHALSPSTSAKPAATLMTTRVFSSHAPTRLQPLPRFATKRLDGNTHPQLDTSPKWDSPMTVIRRFGASRTVLNNAKANTEKTDVANGADRSNLDADQTQPPQLEEFGRSEKANKAAQVNMRARLSKEGKGPKKKWNDSLGEIWRLLNVARREVKYLSMAVGLLLISSAVTMSIPVSVGKIMDLASKGDADATLYGLSLYQFFGALGIVLTVGAMANFGRIILLRIIGERVVARLRSQLYRKTYIQDAEFFDANRVGDLMSRLNADTIIVGKSITQNVSDGLRSVVTGAAGIGAMAWISPGLTSVILLTAPFVATAAFLYARAMRRVSRDIQKNLGTLSKIAEERLGNIRTSQAFTGEIQEMHRYNRQVRNVFSLGKKESRYSAMFFASTGWMGNMTIMALLWFGGGFVRADVLSLGDLTTFMMYTVFTGSSLFGLSGFFSELMRGAGAATRVFELQDRPIGIHPTKGTKVVSAQGPIKFSNVSFAYPTRPAVKIFNGLNFEIVPGSNVCIVGPSGGGKSTVASLLLRFYDPTSGSIAINGKNIAEMNVRSLRRRIGMVSQEPVLFSGTVAENIAYGRPTAARHEIVAAAQKANCQFIGDFPDGLDTQVGARGTQLSGGQKQRIAIARALLKDPDILILDEATSALDAESETLVNAALAELLKGRNTTISIAHRLSTIKRSDQIIVLSRSGTVAEIGTYPQLSANKDSAFSKLMEWQLEHKQMQEPHHPSPRITEQDEVEEDVEEDEEEDAERAREPAEHGQKVRD